MSKRIISIILIAAGIVLLAYPKAVEMHNEYLQKKLMDEWQAALATIDEGVSSTPEILPISQTPDLATEENSLREKPEEEPPEESQEELIEEPAENSAESPTTREEKARQEYIKNHMEGLLRIERIDLELPILKGATENNLDISVAHLENTGRMGEFGNYAIAGHRSHSYGRIFNRLDELEVDDLVEVTDGKNTYTYLVTQKMYVTPSETQVLNSQKDCKEITLITCHPMVNPTHRLIIKGKILLD